MICIFFSILWLYSCIGFVFQLIPALEFLQSPVNVLCDGAIILLSLASIRKQSLKYFYMFSAVIFIGIISYIYNYDGISPMQFFNGTRGFIPAFFSLIFITNMLYSRKKIRFFQAMNAYIIAYLILQIPVSILQFAYFNVGNGDAVGGTAGWGHAGSMSILIYLCTFFVLMQNFDSNRILKSLFANKWLFLCWIPSFINETKITMILIAMFFALCLNVSFAKIQKNIIIIALSLIILFLYFSAYKKYEAGGRGIDEILTSGYYAAEFGESDDKYTINEDYDLPRLLRTLITFDLLTENTRTFFFGKSFGHFNVSSMELTKFAKEYDYLVKGSNPFFIIVILQVGILGFLIVYSAMFIGISSQKNILPRLNSNYNRMRFFLVTMLILISYYIAVFRFFNFSILFFYLGMWASLPNHIRKELETVSFTRMKMRFNILPRRNNAYCFI